MQTYYYPDAKVYHLVRGSSESGKKGAILGIYRGLIYFYRKHFAPWQLGMVKFLLQIKAGGAFFLGFLTNNKYLKETYAEAFKLAQ